MTVASWHRLSPSNEHKRPPALSFMSQPNTHISLRRNVDSGWTPYDPQTGLELHQHRDLWLDDGSVILWAEKTIFRVHKSQLSRHSILFYDLFALAEAEGTHMVSESSEEAGARQRILGGCPVVFLPNDSAEDLGYLLAALYDGLSFSPTLEQKNVDYFRVVAGILRLSTKYLIDSLREKALEHLSQSWPSTLKSWDAREDRVRSHELPKGSSSQYGLHRRPGVCGSPVDVIELAQAVSAPSLLAAAFYDLSRYSFSEIFKTPSSSIMPLLDVQRLCLGKEHASHAITSLIQTMGTNPLPNPIPQHGHFRRSSTPNGICLSATACRKDFAELVELATQHYLFDRERGSCDPLYVAEELGQLKSTEFSVGECRACAKNLENWAQRERERIWKMIPGWFGLDTSVPSEGSPLR